MEMDGGRVRGQLGVRQLAGSGRGGGKLGPIMLENLLVEVAMAVIIGMKRASQIVPWVLLLPQGNPI